jgi:hypothetical protein
VGNSWRSRPNGSAARDKTDDYAIRKPLLEMTVQNAILIVGGKQNE